MNLLLFESDELVDGQLTLTDHRLDHLYDVLDVEPGDSVRVGEIGGLMGEATVVDLQTESISLEVALSQAPPPKLPLTMVLALPRPKMLRRILRNVAELGVSELILLNTYRVEKSFWKTPALAPDVVRHYFLEGLSQSRDTVLPTCTIENRFKPFVEDRLPGMLEGKHGWIAHPGLGAAAGKLGEGEHIVFVGPEGGFIPYEVDMLIAAGCEGIHLGPRILRVENAVTTLISRLFA